MSHAALARALLEQPLSLVVGAIRAHGDVRRRKIKTLRGKKNSNAPEFDASAAVNCVGRCCRWLYIM